MPICAVKTCRNKSVTQNLTRGGVSYHRFPRNPKIKEEWISATGKQNWIPSKVATICSDHFEPCHFVQKTGERRYLHVTAVPSRNVHSFQGLQQLTKVASSLDVDFSSSSLSSYLDTSSLLYTSLAQGTRLSPVTVFSSPAPANYDINSSESVNEVTSIEVEIMPENRIILRPRDNSFLKPDENMNSQTREEDRREMELMQAKIREQDLLIRKLKVRNYRLKKRLFSLKSMEATDS